MKNLLLVFSVLFLSSFTFGNSEINSDLSTSVDELIVQEDDFASPCQDIANYVQLELEELWEELPNGNAMAAGAGNAVLNACCKILPSAC